MLIVREQLSAYKEALYFPTFACCGQSQHVFFGRAGGIPFPKRDPKSREFSCVLLSTSVRLLLPKGAGIHGALPKLIVQCCRPAMKMAFQFEVFF